MPFPAFLRDNLRWLAGGFPLTFFSTFGQLTMAVMVFATAIGPGLTGFLIDRGVYYPAQIAAMGLYCFTMCFLMLATSRRIAARVGAMVPALAGAAS
jgi:hypothetical protein